MAMYSSVPNGRRDDLPIINSSDIFIVVQPIRSHRARVSFTGRCFGSSKRLARHSGHVRLLLCENHLYKQASWNTCAHTMSRTGSDCRTSQRHIEQHRVSSSGGGIGGGSFGWWYPQHDVPPFGGREHGFPVRFTMARQRFMIVNRTRF